MGVNDPPACAGAPIDLGRVPPHVTFASTRIETEGQNGDFTVRLDLGIEDPVALDADIPPQLGIELAKSVQPVDSLRMKRIEIDDIWVAYLQETIGVAFVPSGRARPAPAKGFRRQYRLRTFEFPLLFPSKFSSSHPGDARRPQNDAAALRLWPCTRIDTCTRLSAAGVTPGMRLAWPMVMGRTRVKVSRISRERPLMAA